ncbi:transposase [Streptosporangium subroseum]|uniref:transposase n=1 Tax=Streptosporangium subroseum TaxID=106412 RepID=UPI0034168CB9
MSISDQTPTVRQDGRVAPRANRPKRRTFTASYKAKILEEFDALPEGGSERGALLRREGLYHSHLDNWRRSRESGALKGLSPKTATSSEAQELARLRAENRKLTAELGKTKSELGKTKTALSIAGKAFALLEEISESADSDAKPAE